MHDAVGTTDGVYVTCAGDTFDLRFNRVSDSLQFVCTTAFIFALMAFAAGFLVRPFGALVFGRLGDMIGRKYTFLVTILLMGFGVGYSLAGCITRT